jgi:hypothetical protein
LSQVASNDARSGDRSDKEESAGGFRRYGNCALPLDYSMGGANDCVTTGCASMSMLLRLLYRDLFAWIGIWKYSQRFV